jgi:hypothetical protein
VIAYTDNLVVARAAYKAAVEQYPKSRIRLRQRALVLEQHVPLRLAALCSTLLPPLLR